VLAADNDGWRRTDAQALRVGQQPRGDRES
jgi:hypothetical protein